MREQERTMMERGTQMRSSCEAAHHPMNPQVVVHHPEHLPELLLDIGFPKDFAYPCMPSS
jgi:hypothetical protein